jgi:hypothetical protein
MAIQSIVVNVHSGARIVLHPQGGLDLEVYVDGPGWVLDNDADVSDYQLHTWLMESLRIVENAEHKTAEPMRATERLKVY